jgi:uncharacterized protein (TIGR02145 family)
LGIGYSKGVKIDLGVAGKVGDGIVAGIEAAGGGGVKVTYDFVNLDRQVYAYTFCSGGYTIGVGLAAELNASIGFSGVNEVITGIRYHGTSSGLNKYAGQSLSTSYSLSGKAATVLGIDLSLGIGTSSGAVADFNGIENLMPCPGSMIVIENGTKGYSFKVAGTLSIGAQGDLLAACSVNKVGTNTFGIADTYKKFSSNRVLAGLMMANEICLKGPIDGIIAIPGLTDLAASTVAIIYSLKDFSNCPSEIPAIGTKAIINIASTSVVSGGIITNDGGGNVTTHGVVWNTSENPTINTKMGITNDGQGIGEYTSTITSLTANTTYYVRAYATNSAGTAYGSELTFTTSAAAPVIPALTTVVATSITQTTASSGGNITSNGGATVTSSGVCWSSTTGPTTALTTKTTDGSVTGSFTSSITGLTANTTYYVKAYATNSVGVAYGSELTFTTSAVTSTVPGAPTIVTATAGNAQAVVTFTAPVSNGGSAITGYTVTSSPGNIIGSGSTSPITVTGLTNGTAYTFTVTATNAIGTSLASSASNSVIPASSSGIVNDIDGNAYNTVTIGTQVWMAENLKTTKYNDNSTIPLVTAASAWATLTTPSYCWYNNDAATYKATYGALYNWYTVDVASNGGKNVCPRGWHVPTDAEWTTLTTYLVIYSGNKLKETGTTHWTTPNTGATNETGFTALPGGYRDTAGSYYYVGDDGNWWSSTEYSAAHAWVRNMNYSNIDVGRYYNYKLFGFSVRCVRDF